MADERSGFSAKAWRFSEVYHLGSPKAEYGTGFRSTLVGFGLLLAFFALPLYCAGGFRSSQGWLAFSIVLVCLLLGVLVASSQRNWRLFVYDGGFVVLKGRNTQVVPWDEVSGITQISMPLGRAYAMKTSTAPQYYVRLNSGKVVVLNYQFDKLKELVETIENEMRKRGVDVPEA